MNTPRRRSRRFVVLFPLLAALPNSLSASASSANESLTLEPTPPASTQTPSRAIPNIPSAPNTISARGIDLLASRDRARAGDPALAPVMKDLVASAEKAMTEGPFSVVSKTGLPPSGDKHDYASLSPYWWPDPSKPDGKPYIRRDGEFNPERQNYDVAPLDKLSETTEALAMGYFLTGDEKYANRCAELLRAWFIRPDTRMNPNLRFAQFVPGYDKPRPSGIIEGGRFRKVVDAVQLLQGSPAWPAENDAAVKAWFGQLVDYILTSDQGRDELGTNNNHATWAHVQVATYLLMAGDTAKARDLIDTGFRRLIASQIEPDGKQPEELARTMSFHYSRFNLQALIELAALGDRVGLDLWNVTGKQGQGIRTALDFLLPYALGEKEWKKDDLRGVRSGEMIVVLRRAANAYNEPRYEAAAKKLQEKDRRAMVDFVFPPR